MNNLTTRKIILGLLMMLVLAFSVQGIADAITGISTTTSETQYLTDPIEVTNGVFSIAVTVALQTPDKKNNNYSAIPADHAAVSGVQGTYYYDSSKYRVTETGTLPVLTSRYRISEADAFYYNEEAITISGSSGITFYGSVQGSSVTLKETETGSKRLTASITLTGYATTTGTKTITVTDATPSADLKSTDEKAETLTHKIYVVNAAPTIPPTISLKGITNGFKSRVYGNNDVPIHDRNSPSNYRVTYAVTAGSGTLYLQEGEIESLRTTTTPKTLTTSTAAKVFLDANMSGVTEDYSDGETHTVTATVDSTVSNGTNTVGVYIYGQPTVMTEVKSLEVGSLEHGHPGQRIENAFTVTVMDGKGTPGTVVQRVPVKFEVKDKTNAGGTLINAVSGTIVDSDNRLKTDADGIRLTEETGKTLYVRTGANGVATVNFLLGDAGEQKVFVSAVGMPRKEYSLFTTSIRTGKELSNPTIQSSEGKYNLYVTVTEEDENVNDWNVEFRTSKGTLTNTPTSPDTTSPTPNDDNPDNDIAATMTRVEDRTDARGIAWVIYDPKGSTGDLIVTASVTDNATGTGDIIDDVTFNVRGGDPDPDPQPDPQPTNTITISPSTITGAPGETVTITISNPVGVAVSLSSPNSGFPESNFSPATGSATSFTSTVTLPSTDGPYTVFAVGTIGGQTVSDSATVTVETTAPGSLTIEALGAPANGSQAVRVTVRESDGTLKSDALSVTLTGPGISRAVETVGTGAAAVTVPTATTSYTLTASAAGYTSGSITLSTTTGQTGGSTPPPAGPAGEADSVEIDGSRQLSGTVDQAMRLRVRVLDANDNGVSDVRVTFRVLAPGRGTFAGARGNGRAVADQTDRNGYASANLTPSDDGDLIVRASAAGVSADVTFIIDVGEAAADTETPTPSRDEVPSREISPVVHVGAASRPPMLWVDGGAIYALVDASPQRFAPGVDNALNITVGDGKVYWTEMTGERGGTINSANVDGSGVTELASIFATPMGIAVDVTNSKLYWTNSAGRIQSANLDGSRITNVLQNRPGPKDIAVARGNVYWTEYDATAGTGNVGLVNPTAAQTVARYISTGSDTPGSLAINSNKVYWTEATGGSGGTINSANLNGTGATQLASILAVPSGIAVDNARSKLYWTNSRGRVQSANLDGSRIANVVSGLGSPGDMVLSNSISAPAGAGSSTGSGTTASDSKYDVNGDGKFDSGDDDALLLAISVGSTDAKYDVDGDGTVDIFDLVDLRVELRAAASAPSPTIVGMKMSVAQIDRLQEQIDLLIASGDRSPAAIKTLIHLQQLIATARPEKTQLLANYPNPFNPETWIPYELATDTHVKITIYNTQGVVIRTLQFGHQSAGYYVGRDRAAYWDGRNALGEQVASGLYFYQLETDEMSSMRKMVILK